MSQIDQMESNAISLFNERYVMNAKKPKMNKVFTRSKMERQLENMFDRNTKVTPYDRKKRQLEARDRVRRAFS